MKINNLIAFFSILLLSRPIILLAEEKPNANPTASPTVELPQVEENYTYDPTNKRDPFKPFNINSTPDIKNGSPLTAYTLGQLRLAAVASSPTGEKKAIVEDSQGRGYTVTKGAFIGKEGGQIIEILDDKLIVEINKVDFTGKEHKSTQELKIHLSSPSGQIKSTDRNSNKKK